MSFAGCRVGRGPPPATGASAARQGSVMISPWVRARPAGRGFTVRAGGGAQARLYQVTLAPLLKVSVCVGENRVGLKSPEKAGMPVPATTG